MSRNVPNTNTGHGHVWPRPDGVKARCGGPAMCRECARDLALVRAHEEKQSDRRSDALVDRAAVRRRSDAWAPCPAGCLAERSAADVPGLLAEVDRLSGVDVDALRELAGALNRMEAAHPNPFYVGFGAGILAAIGEPTDYTGAPVVFERGDR